MSESISFVAPPSGRYFIKMHGLRNHFVITDARNVPYRPDTAEVVRICDSEIGVGGDQLIVLQRPTTAGKQKGAYAFMRILNVDGREVEACGNATRCVAWLLMEELNNDRVVVETLAGNLECRKTGILEANCTMGQILTDWRDIPLAEERDTSHLDLSFGPLNDPIALNIGNPHLVYFVPDLDTVDVESLAPKIQSHPLFPEQVNIGVAQMLSDDSLRLMVYERGAGLTTACGSGACVAVYAALIRRLSVNRTMIVHMPAGDVKIEITEDNNAIMTGPVAYCFSGYYR